MVSDRNTSSMQNSYSRQDGARLALERDHNEAEANLDVLRGGEAIGLVQALQHLIRQRGWPSNL